MTQEQDFANDLIDFIHHSPSPYHVVENLAATLVADGFVRLTLTDRWRLNRGGKYFVTRNDSALIAFVVGSGEIEQRFRWSRHTPTLPVCVSSPRRKWSWKMPISCSTPRYMAAPSSIPGSIGLCPLPGGSASKATIRLRPEMRLVHLDGPVLTIPNQSLHMNRKVNEGIELNRQTDMSPLLAGVKEDFEQDRFLAKRFAALLAVEVERIVDFDLVLSETAKAPCSVSTGSSSQARSWITWRWCMQGCMPCWDRAAATTSVLVCFDNEEIGSRTKQGAASPFLRTVLERISIAAGKEREDFFRAVYASYLLSADMGHGLHPNAAGKHDPVNRPLLNGGPMIKVAANQNFTTDGDLVVIYEGLAETPVFLCRGL